MPFNKVIVFGPTGNIASVAARTAHERGAEVVLAMRDPKKPIRGLSAEEEDAGRFSRIEADLTNPDSVATAVKTTGATSAFFYVAMGSKDHMKSTIQALKSSGVQFIVFLSSYTVLPYEGDLVACPPSERIPFIHAQVEANLAEIFGSGNYVAVRPGGFATNTLMWKPEIAAREVKLQGSDVKFDYITPSDMGKVCGKILTTGPQNGEQAVYLYGPQLLAQKDAIAAIGKAVGAVVKITPVEGSESVEAYKARGMPEPVAKYIVERMEELVDGTGVAADVSHWERNKGNVERYTGKPALTFEEWVGQNKELFKA